MRKIIEFQIDQNGCYICTSHYINYDGYPLYWWKKRVTRMARALYEWEFGKIPRGLVIRHKCNNRGCINLNHLCLGTQGDNVMDSVKWGTHKNPVMYGENNGYAKLTKRIVRKIYRMKDLDKSLTLDKIVERLKIDIGRATISLILRGEIWQNVYAEYYK